MYISEPLKTLWRAHCATEAMVLPGWAQTWSQLKAVMLNALGTPQERRKIAYEQIKNCKQLANQSPTELLDYLRPLWEELGNSVPPDLQVIQFTSALKPEIQADIERLPVLMRGTLPAVEEQANIIYRRINLHKAPKDPQTGTKPAQRKESPKEPTGDRKNPQSRKRRKNGPSGTKRPNKPEGAEKDRPTVCFNCGEPGHRSPECTNPHKPGSDPRKSTPGKDKGQKS
jgi:hypothetical protein